jgi:DNA-binding NarL/FixJ family response regulator
MNTHTDVALILWNPDVIELVSLILQRRNLTSCGVEPSNGPKVIEDLITSSQPNVVVFDLEPPYDHSADVVKWLLYRFPDPSLVITCADKALALKKAPWLSDYPVLQKPYEMDDIANVVRFRFKRRRSMDTLAIGAS